MEILPFPTPPDMGQDGPTTQTVARRSTRVRVQIPVSVTSLEADVTFSQICQTIIVNVHGCAVRTPKPLKFGTRVHLRVRQGNEATARVVLAQPLGDGNANWIVGLELEKPANIWGLNPCPEDWITAQTQAGQSSPSPSSQIGDGQSFSMPTLKMPVWPLAGPATKKTSLAKSSGGELGKQVAAQAEIIASLKHEFASSLAAVPELVRSEVLTVQEEVLVRAREETSSALAELGRPLQKELATLRERAEEFRKLQSAEVATSLQAIPELIRQQLAAVQEQMLAQAREQAGATFAELMRPLQQEMASLRESAKESQELQSAEIASTLRAAPEAVRQQVAAIHEQVLTQAREQAGATFAELAQPLRQELAGLRESAKESQLLQSKLAAQLDQIPQIIKQQVQADLGPMLEQARAELRQTTSHADAQYEEFRSRNQQERAAAESLRNELAKARESLENSVQNLPQRIQEPVAATVADALARAREEFRSWLAEREQAYTRAVRECLEQVAAESVSKATGTLEEAFIAQVTKQEDRAKSVLDQQFKPLLKQADEVRKETVSLLRVIQSESEQWQAEVRTLRAEKEQLSTWIAERTSDFQEAFNSTLAETTGQIKGRLQMAIEMVQQPVEKLRQEATQELQEQVNTQSQQLRERIDEACDRLTRLQQEIEQSLGASLRQRSVEISATFEREIKDLAQQSIEQWRSALAKNLESVSTLLARQLPGGEKKKHSPE